MPGTHTITNPCLCRYPPRKKNSCLGRHPHGRKKEASASCRRPVPARTEEKKKNPFLRRHLHGTECFGPTRNENIFGVSGTTRKRHEVVLGATHHKCLMPGAWYSVPARTHKNKSLCLVLSTTTCVDVRTHGRKSLFAPAPGLRTHGRKKKQALSSGPAPATPVRTEGEKGL